MKARLMCRLRSGVTQAFSLKGEECVIGRETGMGVAVPMDGVSRQHARILFDGQSYTLEDLSSTNGTFLNGQRVVREKLRHLDVVGLGKQAELVFVLRPEGAASVKRMGIVRAVLVPDAPDALPYEVATGEAVLGRSSTCNVVAEGGAVSKVHARVVRSADQLLVEDLGSSNGTFVNGERVMTAALRDGDLLALGGVAVFRVVVEIGEITSSSGSHPALSLPAPEAEQFSREWKTRFEWDASEQAAIAEVRRLAAERDERVRSKAGEPIPPPRSRDHRTEAVPLLAKPAAVPTPKAPEPPPPPVAPSRPTAPARAVAPQPEVQKAPPRPAAPAAPPAPPAPVAPPTPAAPVPAAAPQTPEAAPAAAPLATKPERPPALVAPTPEAKPEDVSAPAQTLVEAATQVAASPPALEPAAPAPGPILEVRLTAGDIDVAVHETGGHTLGRAKDAGLRVNHPTVSRVHARLVISDDRRSAYIQDLGGANGTRVNGKPVVQMQAFADGDTIGVGEVELRASIRRGEPRPTGP